MYFLLALVLVGHAGDGSCEEDATPKIRPHIVGKDFVSSRTECIFDITFGISSDELHQHLKRGCFEKPQLKIPFVPRWSFINDELYLVEAQFQYFSDDGWSWWMRRNWDVLELWLTARFGQSGEVVCNEDKVCNEDQVCNENQMKTSSISEGELYCEHVREGDGWFVGHVIIPSPGARLPTVHTVFFGDIERYLSLNR